MPADPSETTRALLAALSAGFPGSFAVRLWDRGEWKHGAGEPGFALVLKHPGAVRAMFWPFTNVGLGESYIFDDFDVEGDVFAFTEWIKHLVGRSDAAGVWEKLALLRALLRLPNQKNPRDRAKAGTPSGGDRSVGRDRDAIRHAYDLPGEFYRLFLDPHMQYTCAYFAADDEGLDAAQERKMDHVCRKLRLKPGERLLDFGCGWGGLTRYAAKKYGVEAVGVTLSAEQAAWAELAAREVGLSDRVRIESKDYREFSAPGAFDKAVSVGIAEHVGNKNLPGFFAKVAECLKPGGSYLHHAIHLRPNTPYPRWTAFARKYVFPNGDLQTHVRAVDSAAGAGLELRDVENLREHYALTLRHWVRRLEANREKALALTDEVNYRIYRLYMAGATLGFRSGVYNLYQMLFVKPDAGRSGVPLTRADWYLGGTP